MKNVESWKFAGESIPDKVLPKLWDMVYRCEEDIICEDLNGVTVIMFHKKDISLP